jgi:6-phosphofructokinase 1
MPTVVRKSSRPYAWEIGMAPLSQVANVEKFMPRDFISADGYGITDPCREYLYPLIGGEDYPAYENGLPRYVTLKNAAVARKLAEFKLS